jgi:hypothetical protein
MAYGARESDALAREGRGPRVMHVGRRTLITKEAAAAWLQENLE